MVNTLYVKDLSLRATFPSYAMKLEIKQISRKAMVVYYEKHNVKNPEGKPFNRKNLN